MLARREFLPSNVVGLTLPAAASCALARTAHARADSSLASESGSFGCWNDWPLYLTANGKEARARRKAALESLHAEAQVRERVEFIRKKVWDLVGGPRDETLTESAVRTRYQKAASHYSTLSGTGLLQTLSPSIPSICPRRFGLVREKLSDRDILLTNVKALNRITRAIQSQAVRFTFSAAAR